VKSEEGPLSRQRKRDPHARDGRKRRTAQVNLADFTTTSRAQGKLAKPHVGFPVYYPRKLLLGSSYAEDAPRTYTINAPGDDRFRAYKLVVSSGYIGEYYGVMGTSWDDPPILDDPSETRVMRGREYLLFYNGSRLRVVGWKTERGSYWISNTLLQTLSSREMLGIARSLTRVK
jgi:polyisoprenyl-teichoic acid--peptidoglycan teichoic acid transferase